LGFYQLEIGTLRKVFDLEVEYDNSAWKTPEEDDGECKAEKFTAKLELLKSNKPWFDIKVHRAEYAFSKGCRTAYVVREADVIYYFKDGKYVASGN
jgi:hypothetical protein